MKISFSLLLATLLIFTLAPNAYAESEVVQCIVPQQVNIKTDFGGKYCNIYDRKLAYRETARELRQQIKERQKNFVAPSLKARRQYEIDLEAMHNSVDAGAE